MKDNTLTSSKYDYVSIDSIFTKIDREYGMDKIDEADAIEQIGEALGFIGVKGEYEGAIAFIEVKEHQGIIPGGGVKLIHQVAKNNCFDGTSTTDAICPAEVVLEVTTGEATCPVVIDCHGTPLQEYDLAYYRPYFDLKWEYEGWGNSSMYKKFTPVRLATHNFFSSIICEDTNIVEDCKDQYTFITKSHLRFSFRDGQVAIAYDRVKTDDKGYPMIPDEVHFIKACANYCIMMSLKKEMYKHRDGSVALYNTAKDDWETACVQAGCFDLMPKGEDELQNMADNKNSLIPRTRDYFNFFGNLNRPEQRRFNNPDFRNKRYGR